MSKYEESIVNVQVVELGLEYKAWGKTATAKCITRKRLFLENVTQLDGLKKCCSKIAMFKMKLTAL